MIKALDETVLTGLKAVGAIPDLIRSSRAGSLIEYTKTARAEPTTMVEKTLIHLPYTTDIMHALTSIFSGYYLQAIAISANVGQVDVIKLLDKVNPNRSPVENTGMFLGSSISQESYNYQLPRPGQPVGLEAFGLEATGKGATLGRDTVKAAQEIANLSVGKLLEVNIESDGHKAIIPVAVRLIVTSVDTETAVNILSAGSKDRSMRERYHGWRAGQLSTWRDMVMCQDLIDEHRRTLLKDKSGIYKQSIDKSRRNKLSGIISLNPSVATASNISVISEETARRVEAAVGGKLKDFRTREKIFKETYMMLMVVVDTAWESVTIYHRSIEMPTELHVKEIKMANKSGSTDVSEILKAYQLGNAPSI